MREAIDIGAQQIFHIIELHDVGEDVHVVLVRFVDDRPIQIRMKLLDRSSAIVNPDLHHIGLLGREFAHIGTRFLFCGHAIRGIPHRSTGARVGHAEAAASRQEQRTRRRLGAELIRQIATRRTRFEDRGYTVIGKAVENVGEILARVVGLREVDPLAIAHMHMRVDKGRHHGLARQIDTRAARGQADFPLMADLRNLIAGHDEGGAFDDSAVAGDQARALEQRLRARRRNHRHNSNRRGHEERG